MADDQDPFAIATQSDQDDLMNDQNIKLGLGGLISPASAQSLVMPPPSSPAKSGPGQSTPVTGSLAGAPQQAQPKVSGPAMIPGIAAKPENLGVSAQSGVSQSPIGAVARPSSQSTAPSQTAAQFSRDQANYSASAGSKPGVDTVKNRWGRILGQVGDIAGSIVAPGIAQWIPGTTLNHQREVNNAGARVAEDQNLLNQQAQTQGVQAQTAYRNAQAQSDAPRPITQQEAAAMGNPSLEGQMWTPKAIAAYTGTNSKNQATLKKQQGVLEAQAAKNGQTVSFDDQGNPVFKDDPNSATFQQRQAMQQYRSAMQKIAQERADIARQGVTPGSPAWNQKQAQLNIEAERAKAYWGNYLDRALGVDMKGQPLPGAPLTDTDQPVGSSNAANVRPTSQERGRADLAVSAQHQLNTMRSILASKPNLFGPGSGRYTTFQAWLGSQDPDAQRFRAASRVATDHLVGVFGGRSEYAIKGLDDIVGQMATNPQAAIAGISQIESSLPRFIKQGTVRTVGSNVAQPGGLNPPNQPPTNTPKLTPQQRVLIRDGKGGKISRQTAEAYVAKAGGDTKAAQRLAEKDHWKF